MYASFIDGVRDYQATVRSNVEVNKVTPKVQLSKNNISEVQSLNLKAFQKSNNDKNPHAMLNKQYGRYYSIKFDSTQKFFQELNGSMIQTVFSCNTIINFPCSLTTIEGESLIMKIVTFFCSMIDRQKC